ncbi:MAG: AAA family ATPase [Hyphomicrobiaceae bacterium]
MRVVNLCNTKGGVGKSTLTINLACAALEDGLSVRIIDLDPQGSVALWSEIRSSVKSTGTYPPVKTATFGELKRELRTPESAEADYVFLDTPGGEIEDLAEAMNLSDLILVPSRTSLMDIQPAISTLQQALLQSRTACCVINFVPRNDEQLFRSVKQQLEQVGLLVCPVLISDEPAFSVAFAKGLSAMEHQPKGKATEDIRWLWRYIKGFV